MRSSGRVTSRNKRGSFWHAPVIILTVRSLENTQKSANTVEEEALIGSIERAERVAELPWAAQKYAYVD